MSNKNIHKKQQKALKRKRRARMRKAKASISDAGKSYASIAAKTSQMPIDKCYISPDWDKTHLAQITIVRRLPDNSVTLGAYIVDTMCLGVKDAMLHHDLPLSKFREFMERYYPFGVTECSADFAHQLIYQAIDYAAQFGFRPHKDFIRGQKFLIPREELAETHKFSFGQENGKPLFIAGPYDDIPAIMKKLEKNAGAGNFDFILPADLDDEFYQDDDVYDD